MLLTRPIPIETPLNSGEEEYIINETICMKKYAVILFLVLCTLIYAQQQSDSIKTLKKTERITAIRTNFDSKRTMFNVVCGVGTGVSKILIFEGFKVTPEFVIGLGTGQMGYLNNTAVPILLNLKYPELILKNHLSLFEISAGTALTWNYWTGLNFNVYILNPSYSFGFPVGKKCFLTLGADCDVHLFSYPSLKLVSSVGLKMGFIY